MIRWRTRAVTDAPQPASPNGASAEDACRNCGARASGAYCPNCGQETKIALPTLRVFIREAAGRYVALDGRLWRTLSALLFRPGFLTREFFEGRRRRYVRPARLFLVLSIVAFAVVRFESNPPVVVETSEENAKSPPTKNSAPSKAASDASKDTTDDDVGFTIGRDLDVHVGGESAQLVPLKKRLDAFNQLSRQQKVDTLFAGAFRFGPYAMIVLLPLFALLMKFVYLGRARRYPLRPRRYAAHLVFGAHNHAFLFAVVTLMALLPLGGPVRWILLTWALIYLFLSMRVVYGGRWSGVLLRGALVGFVYLILFLFAIAGLIVAAAIAQ